MNQSMTTTTFGVDGFRVKRSLGVVRGITVRSRSIFGTIGAGLQTILGGNITLLTNLCEKTRSEAFDLMLQHGGNITLFTELCEKTRGEAFEMMMRHAQEMGANAVIGVRYDATEVMQGVTEVLCYGTAVVVEPNG